MKFTLRYFLLCLVVIAVASDQAVNDQPLNDESSVEADSTQLQMDEADSESYVAEDDNAREKRQVGRAIGWAIRKLGPSGKPAQHFKNFNNRKAAQNAAQNAGKGRPPVHHPAHQPGQRPHFHPADKNGNKRGDGSHYQYPKKG